MTKVVYMAIIREHMLQDFPSLKIQIPRVNFPPPSDASNCVGAVQTGSVRAGTVPYRFTEKGEKEEKVEKKQRNIHSVAVQSL